VKLSIKVVPGSSQDCIAGWLGDALKVKVKAPPEAGKANVAVEKILVKTLGLSKGSVRIVSGTSSSRKIVEIEGLSEVELARRLS
jgi:uncharacterized protein (TIGR00251 family)